METNLPSPKTRKTISIPSIVSVVSGVLTYALVIFHSLIEMKLLLAVFLAPITALIAVISGHKASRQIRRGEGQVAGKKLARTGLLLGYLYFVICIVLILLAVLLFGGIASGLTKLLGTLGL